MKRFSAVLVAVLLLCLAIMPMSASAAEEKPLWITHYNDAFVEGSGVIMTTEYSGAQWWIHFAFAPTNVENVYQIVETVSGLAEGNAVPLAIPEGGFVYALNYGNDYISLGSGDTDFTSPACTSAIADYAANWMVGTNIKFTGLDLEGFTVPTSTAGTNWYDDSYVCTATYSIYEGDVTLGGGEETSAPAEESSEEPAESSVAAEESVDTTAAIEDSTVAATESSVSESSVAVEESEGLGVWLWVIIGAAVVVVAVVVVIVTKKK